MFKKGDKVLWDKTEECIIASSESAPLAYGNGTGWKIKRISDGKIMWVREDQLTRAENSKYEKGGRSLMEWENGDLTLPELKQKLQIAIEGNEDQDTIAMIKDDIRRREKQNAKEFPMFYDCRLLKDGLVSYEDSGCGINLIKKETIDRMLNSFLGKPVVINHMEVTPGNFEKIAVGYITDVRYNAEDGWHWCRFMLINDKAKELIKDGYSVSCAYTVDKLGPGGENHAIRYQNEILSGEGEHLALVPNPRYEECGVPQLVLNSKAARYENETTELGGYRIGDRVELVESEDGKGRVSEFVGGGRMRVRLIDGGFVDVRPEQVRRLNADGIDRESPEAKAQFAKEKKEHPEFTDEDIWKIVRDHMRENAEKKCPACAGEGQLPNGETCPRCKGIGKLENSDPFEVGEQFFIKKGSGTLPASPKRGDEFTYRDYTVRIVEADEYPRGTPGWWVRVVSTKKNAGARFAEKIMQIDNAILNKYNLRSGVDLEKHEDEFIQAVRSSGITSISQEDADELEDQNFHTALAILMRKGFLKKKNAGKDYGCKKCGGHFTAEETKGGKECPECKSGSNLERINQNTKGAGKMATMKEKIVKVLNDLGSMLNEAFEGKETPEEEAAEAKAKKDKEEQDRKNAEEAEKKAKEEEEKKNALKARAAKCGLAENAAEEEIVKKENELKEEEVKKENARKEKEAADAKHFTALNALRETGELQEGLTAPVPETSAERVSRGNARYGSAKK